MAIKFSSSPVSFVKNVPEARFQAYSYLIYGARKIGKTCFASQFNRTVFLMFEHGYKALPVTYAFMKTWDDFKKAVEVLKTDTNYDTVVIDTGGRAYQLCYDEITGGEEMPEDRGTTWANVRNEFERVNNELFSIGKGIVILAHSEERVIKRHGVEETKIRIDLSKQANSYYPGAVNVIGYFHYDNDGKRILTIGGDDTLDAGSQIVGRFLYADGTPINDIPMGKNPKEGYTNFLLAFQNKLEKPKPILKTYTLKKGVAK